MSVFDFSIEKYKFDAENIKLIENNLLAKELYPVVYILYDEKTKKAYVGETTNLKSRLASHLANTHKKKLKDFYVLSSTFFNKSAVLDIESNLIQYIPPAFGYKLLNGNAGMIKHKYYQQEKYRELFTKIWEEVDFKGKVSKNLFELENTDLFKFSPYKTLTAQQYQSVKEILKAILSKSETVFIQGSAGTGKTIVAIYLIKLLTSFHLYEQDDLEIEDHSLRELLIRLKEAYPGGLNIGFVVPMTSLRNTLKEVFSSIHGLKKSMIIGPNGVNKKNYDILLVDEAHRLTRRVGITNYGSFDDMNRHLKLKDGNQLDWIVKSSKTRALFYDPEQSIRPADIRPDSFENLSRQKTSKTVSLESQMRCMGGNNFMSLVDNIFNCKIDRNIKLDNYDFQLFEDLPTMIEKLQELEKKYQLCRLVSGYSWPWQSRYKDQPNYDAVIDGVELIWNINANAWIHSTTDLTEMGCIHTVQGYDLNYVGVILGEEIDYDPESNSIVIFKDKYHDKKGKVSIKDEDELKAYIIKIYKTMMYRGIRGCYLYACNINLRKYLTSLANKLK